jgi:hypothetical protein
MALDGFKFAVVLSEVYVEEGLNHPVITEVDKRVFSSKTL